MEHRTNANCMAHNDDGITGLGIVCTIQEYLIISYVKC